MFPNSSTVYFYIASDSADTVASGRKALGNFVISSEGEAIHAVSGTGREKTLIDEWALVFSDALLVTPGSTFGSAAAMIHARRPFYVDWDNRECKQTDLEHPPFRYETKYTAF